MNVKFVKYHKDAKMPSKAHVDDYGYDVYAVSEEEITPGVWRYGLGFGLQPIRDEQITDVTKSVLDVGDELKNMYSYYRILYRLFWKKENPELYRV